MNNQRDVIIIGAGAAGLSAGLVLARAQANVLVIDAGEPRNAAATHMQGFLTRDGMPPEEFAAAGRREVTAAGGTILPARVGRIDRAGSGGFAVSLADGTALEARALLIATGLKDEIPDIPGAAERWGSTLHHCPYCHGYEVRNQAIGVIGGFAREMSFKQAGLLRRYSDRVTFVTNGIEPTAAERGRLEAFGVPVVEGTVSGLGGEPGERGGITLADGRTVECEAVFIAPRLRPTDELLRSLDCEIDPGTGLVAVDGTGQTSVPGVWAAGNVVTPSAQVITAAGAGSASAIAINGWLLQQDIDTAFAAVGPDGDSPVTTHRKETTMSATQPPRGNAGPPSVHARAVITWLAIFPLVTLGFYAIAPFAGDWNPVLRAFVLSIVVVPLAVYLVVPQLMRAYGKLRTARS